ncbi:hypothetical protein ERJ75_000795100 [Trypanosoma vivax]|nr:hypothetical protein ERJ75_000795100 [Trypanosoma vivax]
MACGQVAQAATKIGLAGNAKPEKRQEAECKAEAEKLTALAETALQHNEESTRREARNRAATDNNENTRPAGAGSQDKSKALSKRDEEDSDAQSSTANKHGSDSAQEGAAGRKGVCAALLFAVSRA